MRKVSYHEALRHRRLVGKVYEGREWSRSSDMVYLEADLVATGYGEHSVTLCSPDSNKPTYFVGWYVEVPD